MLRVNFHTLTHSEIRNSELALILLSCAIGLVVGFGVVLLRDLVALLRHLAFGVALDAHLSDAPALDPLQVLAVPVIGGLAVGLATLLIRRWRPREIVDAIEANALRGGRLSLTDSLNLALLTALSSGVGASVGLEAAYTQLGAGFASRLGQVLRLRRVDLRTMVGCGAAAAIAAAFNAPLAGAFYAFELVIGSYTLATLLPVSAAAVCGTMIARVTLGADPIFIETDPFTLIARDYVVAGALGIAGAGVAIATMVGVTTIEAGLRRLRLPLWLRPALGGLVLGPIALAFPTVLGSGHGAILRVLEGGYALPLMAGMLVAKCVASAVSVGAGFRGGHDIGHPSAFSSPARWRNPSKCDQDGGSGRRRPSRSWKTGWMTMPNKA